MKRQISSSSWFRLRWVRSLPAPPAADNVCSLQGVLRSAPGTCVSFGEPFSVLTNRSRGDMHVTVLSFYVWNYFQKLHFDWDSSFWKSRSLLWAMRLFVGPHSDDYSCTFTITYNTDNKSYRYIFGIKTSEKVFWKVKWCNQQWNHLGI